MSGDDWAFHKKMKALGLRRGKSEDVSASID